MSSLKEELLNIMRPIDFDRRYYSFYEELRDKESDRVWTKEEIARSLAEFDLIFKYVSSDRLFMHSSAVRSTKMSLSVRVRDSEAELLIEIAKESELTGGPFQLLAKEVAESRNPGFSYDPPYPWLPFVSEQDFKAIVRFGIGVFEDIKERWHINDRP